MQEEKEKRYATWIKPKKEQIFKEIKRKQTSGKWLVSWIFFFLFYRSVLGLPKKENKLKKGVWNEMKSGDNNNKKEEDKQKKEKPIP